MKNPILLSFLMASSAIAATGGTPNVTGNADAVSAPSMSSNSEMGARQPINSRGSDYLPGTREGTLPPSRGDGYSQKDLPDESDIVRNDSGPVIDSTADSSDIKGGTGGTGNTTAGGTGVVSNKDTVLAPNSTSDNSNETTAAPGARIADNEMEGAAVDRTLSPAERNIAGKIHAINLFEIEVGRLAKQKGASRDTKAFGDRLVRDHQFVDRKIMNLAKANNISLVDPRPLSEQQADSMKLQKLQGLNGKEFDAVFANEMHAGHEKTIVMLKEDIKTLPESSYLRALVSKTLPILAQHSVVATNMHKKVNEI